MYYEFGRRFTRSARLVVVVLSINPKSTNKPFEINIELVSESDYASSAPTDHFHWKKRNETHHEQDGDSIKNHRRRASSNKSYQLEIGSLIDLEAVAAAAVAMECGIKHLSCLYFNKHHLNRSRSASRATRGGSKVMIIMNHLRNDEPRNV